MHCFLCRLNFYDPKFDQWGSLFGLVQIDNKDIDMYSRGLRQRAKLLPDNNEIRLTGSSMHGFNFTLIQQHHDNPCIGKFENGHIFIPGYATHSLSQIDCPDLTWVFELSEKKAFFSHQIFIHFKAGDRWFNIGIQLGKLIDQNTLSCEMTLNCHRGYAILSRRQ